MREIFKGFLRLRLLAFIPMMIIIVVLVGVAALMRGGADLLGIVVLASVPMLIVAALGALMAWRAGGPRR